MRALVNHHSFLTDRQYQIALILQENPRMNGARLADHLQLNRPAVWRMLQSLQRLGVLSFQLGAWKVTLPDALQRKPLMVVSCRRGHALDPSYRINNRGNRVCRECERQREKRYKAQSSALTTP